MVGVTNPAGSPAYATVDPGALDASGVILCSNEGSLPMIPAHGRFDYFGYVGGGSAVDTP